VGASCSPQPGKLSGRVAGAAALGEVATMAPSKEKGRCGEGGPPVCLCVRSSLALLLLALLQLLPTKVFLADGGSLPEGRWDTPALAEASSCGCSSVAEGERREQGGKEHQGQFLGAHAPVQTFPLFTVTSVFQPWLPACINYSLLPRCIHFKLPLGFRVQKPTDQG